MYFPRTRLGASEAIEIGMASGGVSVIANPMSIQLRSESFFKAFSELAEIGLVWIEAHHPMHPPPLRDNLEEFSADLSLIATGVSDYHGMSKRAYRVGLGVGNMSVPSGAFQAIQEAIAATAREGERANVGLSRQWPVRSIRSFTKLVNRCTATTVSSSSWSTRKAASSASARSRRSSSCASSLAVTT